MQESICVCHKLLFKILSPLSSSNMLFYGLLGASAMLEYSGLALVGL